MTTIPTSATFDVAALRRAFADRDATALAALHADDATLEFVDAEHTPSNPLRVDGRQAIDAYLADLFSREMTHSVEDVALGDGVLGFSVRCRYPDGTRVLCVASARLREGRISHQVAAQAWDVA
jgi:ketosteroid isomerase-like protein